MEHRFDRDYVAEDFADLQAQIGEVFSGMPDLQLEIDDPIAEGDRVMVRFTQSSEAGVNVSSVYIVRLEDGRIVEGWDHTDMLTLFAQLGVVELPQKPDGDHRRLSYTGPQGILVDPDGNVWVIESEHGRRGGRRVGKPGFGSGRDGDDGRHERRAHLRRRRTDGGRSVAVRLRRHGGYPAAHAWPCSTANSTPP